jgi:arsenate reductase (thioredoxin)
MAEAFANHYGADVLRAFSSGLAPTVSVAPATVAVMKEKNIDVSRHVPELYDPRDALECDMIVNMSKVQLPGTPVMSVVEWDVPDPYGGSPALFRSVRDQVEQLVMRLILELRRQPSRGRLPVAR